MKKILISACLLGERVRYDGGDCLLQDSRIQAWQHQGKLIIACPEVMAGLGTPRPAAEITATSRSAPTPDIKVFTKTGRDVSGEFQRGARKVTDLLQHQSILCAILKDGSPSCGSSMIYDGSFSGRKIPGEGLVSRHLKALGIPVFSEREIDAVVRLEAST